MEMVSIRNSSNRLYSPLQVNLAHKTGSGICCRPDPISINTRAFCTSLNQLRKRSLHLPQFNALFRREFLVSNPQRPSSLPGTPPEASCPCSWLSQMGSSPPDLSERIQLLVLSPSHYQHLRNTLQPMSGSRLWSVSCDRRIAMRSNTASHCDYDKAKLNNDTCNLSYPSDWFSKG